MKSWLESLLNGYDKQIVATGFCSMDFREQSRKRMPLKNF
jgi:hypothetical protein